MSPGHGHEPHTHDLPASNPNFPGLIYKPTFRSHFGSIRSLRITSAQAAVAIKSPPAPAPISMIPRTALKESLEVAVASAAKAAQLASVAAAAAASAALKAQEAAGHCDASSEWATESLEAIKVVPVGGVVLPVGGYPKATAAARGVAATASRATGLSTPSAVQRAKEKAVGAIVAAREAREVTAEVLNKLKDAVAAAEEADAAAMEAVVCAEAWGFFIQ